MVFFVCGACGGSFKRKQADMHIHRCPNWSFSCMDCQKDFEGQSYAAHTQCISESEKYFGDHHKPKVGKDKNAIWMEKLKVHLSNQKNMTPFIARFVTRMLQFSSIPRKQTPFNNFLLTNMNLKHEDTIKKLWEIVDGANVAQVPIISSSKGEDTKENGTNGVEKKTEENIPKKKTKRTPDSDEEDEITMAKLQPRESKSARRKRRKIEQSATEEPDMSGISKSGGRDMAELEDIAVDTVDTKRKFKWRRTLKDLLNDAPQNGIKMKKLLNQVEQLHNHPIYGASEPLPKETLDGILRKTLSKKPFSLKGDRAKKGQFAADEED